MTPSLTIEKRFWKYTRKVAPKDCWTWKACADDFGYGVLYIGNNPVKHDKAHRISWKIHFGEVPEGLMMLHHCDNPPCVNPNHLWLGTHADNYADMRRKGRMVAVGPPKGDMHPLRRDPTLRRPGESNGMSTHTAQQARDVWTAKGPQKEIAGRFDVGTSFVSRVRSGRVWKSSVAGFPKGDC